MCIHTYSLYKKIDIEKVQCLNESEEGAGKFVFKPWDERLDRTKVCGAISLPPTHIHAHTHTFQRTNVYLLFMDMNCVKLP